MKNLSWQNTAFTKLVNIEVPIVQGPFGGGFSSVEMTSIVSNLGGLGSFGAQPYTAAEIVSHANLIRKQTNRPFNINLWIDNRDESLKTFDNASFEELKKVFKPYFDKLNLALPELPVDLGPTFEDQIEGILDSKPPVFSFVYGIPPIEMLEQCRKRGIITLGNATTVDEAIALEAGGVDAIVASGFEAGGHRVSFLRSPEESLTGSFSLIPQISDAVKIPFVAAGGIADCRGIKAALTLGADGVQIGTAFLATKESNAPLAHKEKLFSADARYTTLTKLFSGRLARGLTNTITQELRSNEHLHAPYPMQAKFVGPLRAEALKTGRTEYLMCWAGQSSSLLRYKNTGELFTELVNDTSRLYDIAGKKK